jgi:hypothetical protein
VTLATRVAILDELVAREALLAAPAAMASLAINQRSALAGSCPPSLLNPEALGNRR